MIRMTLTLMALGILTMTFTPPSSAENATDGVPAALSFEMKSLTGDEVKLSNYLGKAVLVVNVASECGLTPQYSGLQDLHEKYAEKGLAILGFPCNQFGGQEPGSADEIQHFCQENYGVEFDMFAKVEVNGENTCALYKHLKGQDTSPKGPGDIKWNFEKFLVSRTGEVVARFAPSVKPADTGLVDAIKQQLGE
jgi:glutathione peroxidase